MYTSNGLLTGGPDILDMFIIEEYEPGLKEENMKLKEENERLRKFNNELMERVESQCRILEKRAEKDKIRGVCNQCGITNVPLTHYLCCVCYGKNQR